MDWLLGLFNKDAQSISVSEFIGELTTEIWFKELALQSCVNLIANTLSKAEFQTFEKGKETRKDNYYLFNVQPNPNKSASKFWRDVVSRLVYKNECLVIQQDNHLYVAEDFTVDKKAFREYVYSGVVVEGVLLSRTYLESEVLHFELHNEKIQAVINGLYTAYAKLIEASRKHYLRQNARRGTLTIPTNYPETDKAQQDLRDLMEKRFKRFFDAEGDAVLPLANGLEYTELENKANTGTKGSQEGRDVRGFIDDIFDFVAIALNIPPQLVKGTVADTEKAMDNFLTFCINPLAELISDEVNRKYYGKRAFLERTYLRVNTSMIRSHDIKDIAGALETLLRIGAYSIDDILKVLGMEPLGTDWSTIRWVTKNYQPVTEVVKGTESG
jgi:HK97 family phage portal protein